MVVQLTEYWQDVAERRATPRIVVEAMTVHLDGQDRDIIDISAMSVRIVFPPYLPMPEEPNLIFRSRTDGGTEVYPASACAGRRDAMSLVLFYVVHGLGRRAWAEVLDRHETTRRAGLPAEHLGL